MYSSSETYLHIHFLGILCISQDMPLWNVVFDFWGSMLETKCQVQTVERQLRIVDKVWTLNFWCYNCQVSDFFSLFLMHMVDGGVGIERLKLVILTADVIDLISNSFVSYLLQVFHFIGVYLCLASCQGASYWGINNTFLLIWQFEQLKITFMTFRIFYQGLLFLQSLISHINLLVFLFVHPSFFLYSHPSELQHDIS